MDRVIVRAQESLGYQAECLIPYRLWELSNEHRLLRFYNYSFGLNHTVTLRLCSDKPACYQILQRAGISAIPHILLQNPKRQQSKYARYSGQKTQDDILHMLHAAPSGLVLKPANGSSGRNIFYVTDEKTLHQAIGTLFDYCLNIAVSPYSANAREYRFIMLAGNCILAFEKQKPEGVFQHNLSRGAVPVLITERDYPDLFTLANTGAKTLQLGLGSIDILVGDDGSPAQILEVNTSCCLESFAKTFPDIAEETLRRIIRHCFAVAALGAL